MPWLRMRTMGVGGVHNTATRPWLTSGWRNAHNGSTGGRTGGGSGSIGAARASCGIWAGGRFSMRVKSLSDAPLMLSKNHMKRPAIAASAALPATQTGIVAPTGR